MLNFLKALFNLNRAEHRFNCLCVKCHINSLIENQRETEKPE